MSSVAIIDIPVKADARVKAAIRLGFVNFGPQTDPEDMEAILTKFPINDSIVPDTQALGGRIVSRQRLDITLTEPQATDRFEDALCRDSIDGS
jgi:hypothetical protein